MNQWRKGIASWRIGKVLYISVPFTWLLPDAKRLAAQHTGPVLVGGPAVDLMPDYLSGVADIGGACPVPPIQFHNPLATFTTRGCPNRCSFCAVPKIEGDFREVTDWDPKPVVCDNNLLAASKRHFNTVIDRLKIFPYVDFNQGLDARLFSPYHARRIAELKHAKIRFALDRTGMESVVFNAVKLARENGLKDIGVYVLVGFYDTPEDAVYRLETVRKWKIRPNPMRFQPLDSMTKNNFVSPGWTEFELRRVMKYYSRLRWLEHIPFDDFRPDDMPLFGGVMES